jgi:flagellar assembly protein FliH
MSDTRRTYAAGAAAIERWSMPQVEGNVIGRPLDERKAAAAAAAAEAIARLAREQSEQRGYEAGMAKAQAEMQGKLVELDARIKRFDGVMQFLVRPLEELDADVEKSLLALALSVGKQLARRELRVDPAQVIAIIRESLQELPASAREVRVQLHPEDAAIVRERLTAPVSERAWTFVEDPTMSRGGCVVRAESSQIDARLESRISAVIASVLGDERAAERSAMEEPSTARASGDAPTADTAPGPMFIGVPEPGVQP